MIVQMSRKSDIYHRPGCPYISRIHESYIEAFDMDDHKITHFQPCKYCCNMKTMYRKIQPNLPEIFGIFNYQTEYNGQYIKAVSYTHLHLKHRKHWIESVRSITELLETWNWSL